MKFTLSILALALVASSALAIPFDNRDAALENRDAALENRDAALENRDAALEARDIEIPDDRENCGLKDAQTAEAGSCNAQ